MSKFPFPILVCLVVLVIGGIMCALNGDYGMAVLAGVGFVATALALRQL